MAVLAPANAARGTPTLGCDKNDLAGTLDIVTADLSGAGGYNNGQGNRKCGCNPALAEHADGDYTSCFGGTSAATPITAGVAALILSVNPNLTAADVKDVIVSTADKIDAADAKYKPDQKGRPYSTTHGYGRVNAEAAVTMAAQRKAGGGPPPGGAKKDPPAGTLPVSARAGPEDEERVGGRPAVKIKVPRPKGGDATAYALTEVRALVLAPQASLPEVRSQLPDRFRQLDTPWAKKYADNNNVLVVEAPADVWNPLDKSIAQLIDRGQVTSVGRVVFFDKASEKTVSVLPDEASIGPAGAMTEQAFRDLGLNVRKQMVFNTERLYLQPASRGGDPLDFLAQLKELRQKGLIEPKQQLYLGWIPPRDKRY
jgi:hypothetical protein